MAFLNNTIFKELQWLVQIFTQEYLNLIFEYRDGCLFWKKSFQRVNAGDKAGTIVKNKYIQIEHKRSKFLAHRVIFKMFYGENPKFVDHINGDTFNNKIENLRRATNAQNAQNSKIRIDNFSGVKGVAFVKKSNKWIARVMVNNKSHWCGTYESIELAESAVKSKREQLHGEFARHV